MSTTLKDFCHLLENGANTLEEEIRNSIEICRQSLLNSKLPDTKVALEKAKDYHCKEIINILSGIVTNIKQIMYHENKINQLNNKGKLSEAELKEYSYVKRQVSAFSGGEKVVRRELRRATSENSVYCLDTWENFLKDEVNKDALYLSTSLPNINDVPKRHSPKSKRKQKKLISSTFENILEDDEEARFKSMDTLLEENTNDFREICSDLSKSTPKISCDATLITDIKDTGEHLIDKTQTENEEIESQITDFTDFNEITGCMEDVHQESIKTQKVDTKPKIVGFVVSANRVILFSFQTVYIGHFR